MKIGAMRALLFTAAIAVWSTSANAEPAPRKPTNPAAVDHYTRGSRLYGNAAFQEAIEEFKASALVEPAPAIDFNLAVCYRLIGEATQDNATKRENFNKAIWHYERFVKTSPETPERATEVRKLVDRMRAEIAAMPATPTPAPPPTVQQPVPTPTEPTHIDRGSPKSSDGWYADGVGWALTGSGVASLGVAAGLFVSASSLRDDADATPDQQEQSSLRDRAHTRSLIGTTLAVVGGGLTIGGIVKLVLHDESAQSSSTDTATWNLGVSGSGFVVFGRF